MLTRLVDASHLRGTPSLDPLEWRDFARDLARDFDVLVTDSASYLFVCDAVHAGELCRSARVAFESAGCEDVDAAFFGRERTILVYCTHGCEDFEIKIGAKWWPRLDELADLLTSPASEGAPRDEHLRWGFRDV